jgi:hypothetical protein
MIRTLSAHFSLQWNTALFDSASGHLLHAIDTRMRVTDAVWLKNDTQLALAGMTSQGKKKDGKYPEFGHIKLFDFQRHKA